MEALAGYAEVGKPDMEVLRATQSKVKACYEAYKVCEGRIGTVRLFKLITYCRDNQKLNNRALNGVCTAHVRDSERRMTKDEFISMYAAIEGVAAPTYTRYWFSVLDVDGDGVLGPSDISDFCKVKYVSKIRR